MATERVDVMVQRILVDTKQAERAQDRYARKTRTTAKKTQSEFDKLSASVSKLNNVLFLGGAAALAVGGVRALDEFFTEAERATGVARGFDVLMRRIGETSASMLTELRPASQGLISDMDLMLQANQAIQLGLPVTAESMGDLTEAAVKLGRVMGVDSTRALESLTVGIGRQSKLWLDNLGIIVDVESAHAAYAATLGKTAAQLTDAERKTAFYEATLEAVNDATVGLTGATNTLGSAWQRLGVIISNVIDDLKRDLNEGNLLGLLRFLSPLGGLAPGVGRRGGGIRIPAAAIPPARGPVAEGFPAVGPGGTLAAPGLLAEPSGGFTAGLDAIVNTRTEVQGLVTDYRLLNEALVAGNLTHQQYRAGIENLTTRLEELKELGLNPLPDAYELVRQQQEFSKATTEDWLGVLGQGTAALAQIFPKTKAFAYANAVINTAEGVTRALKSLPYPANIAAAAVTAAAGAAQIATIARTEPGSGGQIRIPGGGGVGRLGGLQSTTGVGQAVEVSVFLNGAGFIQDPAALARDLGDEIGRQLNRSGIVTTVTA